MELTGKQRRYLAREAHHLDPVVMIGRAGATPELKSAVSEALEHHELIKVKFQRFKDEKRAVAEMLAADTDSSLVRIVGNVAVLYRPHEDPNRRRIRPPQE
jgi:RNA-binding protein